jgi:hypothetical protein
MARDPAALFADLHEALRHGRLTYTTAGNYHLKLPPELAHITAVRPVYDCQPVLEQWLDAGRAGDHDTFAAMMNRGVDLADEMLLVAERCAQMWSYYSDGEGLTECVVFIDPAGTAATGLEGWMLHFFEQDYDSAGRVVTIGRRRDRWSFGRVAVKATKWAPEIIPSGFGGNTPDSEHWRAKMDVTFALCGALAQEPVLVEATSSAFTAMNLGRVRGRLAPVPPVRHILDLKRKVYRSNREHEATGHEMPFHFRRGSHRTFRADRYKAAKGKTVTVPGGWVRKDKAPPGDLPAPPIYTVTS